MRRGPTDVALIQSWQTEHFIQAMQQEFYRRARPKRDRSWVSGRWLFPLFAIGAELAKRQRCSRRIADKDGDQWKDFSIRKCK